MLSCSNDGFHLHLHLHFTMSSRWMVRRKCKWFKIRSIPLSSIFDNFPVTRTKHKYFLSLAHFEKCIAVVGCQVEMTRRIFIIFSSHCIAWWKNKREYFIIHSGKYDHVNYYQNHSRKNFFSFRSGIIKWCGASQLTVCSSCKHSIVNVRERVSENFLKRSLKCV